MATTITSRKTISSNGTYSYLATNIRNASATGGAVRFSAAPPQITLTDSAFTGCTGQFGGAVSQDTDSTATGGTFSVLDSTFTNNTASQYGGALNIQGAATTLRNCTFAGNRTTGSSECHGGAIFIHKAANVEIDSCVFEGNSVNTSGGAKGGAIYCHIDGSNGTLTIKNSKFLTSTDTIYCNKNVMILDDGCEVNANIETISRMEISGRVKIGSSLNCSNIVVKNGATLTFGDNYNIYNSNIVCENGANIIFDTSVADLRKISGNPTIYLSDKVTSTMGDASGMTIINGLPVNDVFQVTFDFFRRFSFNPADITPDFLCFTAETTSTISLNKFGYISNPINMNISYDGKNWETYEIGSSIQLNSEHKSVYFKGANSSFSESASGYYNFSITGRTYCSGKITSLYSENLNEKTIPANYMFYGLFKDCSDLLTMPELPAENLTIRCYSDMFYGCSKLTESQILPAKTLANYCYYQMYRECTSLENAGEIEATQYADYACENMFYNCSSLNSVQQVLYPLSIPSYCCYQMYYGCALLEVAPEILATTFSTGACGFMFYHCSSLNQINISFTTWNSAYIQSWTEGVSSTGTFYKPTNLSIERGSSRIPNNWTIVNK